MCMQKDCDGVEYVDVDLTEIEVDTSGWQITKLR